MRVATQKHGYTVMYCDENGGGQASRQPVMRFAIHSASCWQIAERLTTSVCNRRLNMLFGTAISVDDGFRYNWREGMVGIVKIVQTVRAFTTFRIRNLMVSHCV